MRGYFAIMAAFAVISVLLVAALYLGNSRPAQHEPLHNPYWPFTIEISVRDR